MSKHLVLDNPSSGWNKGSDAALIALIDHLRDHIPDLQITLITGDPRKASRWYGVKTVAKTRAVSTMVLNLFRALPAISEADLFILGGDNPFIDASSAFYIPYGLMHCISAILLRKPVVCCGIGAGPIQGRLGRWLTRMVVKRSKWITTRDEYSRTFLKAFGVREAQILVASEPAIGLEPSSPDRAVRLLAEEGVPINGRPIVALIPRRIFHRSYGNLPQGMVLRLGLWSRQKRIASEHYKAVLAQTADYVIEKLHAHVLFIPMSRIKGNDDDALAAEIIGKMRRRESVTVLSGDYNVHDLKGIYGQVALAVGVRFHSVVLASSLGVPVIAIAYDPKVAHFVRQIGQEERLIAPNGLDFDALRSIVDSTWANRDEIRRNLRTAVGLLKENVILNLEQIRSTLEIPGRG